MEDGIMRLIYRLGSIFYIGYLAAQYPVGYALQKLPIGKFLSVTTLCRHRRTLGPFDTLAESFN